MNIPSVRVIEHEYPLKTPRLIQYAFTRKYIISEEEEPSVASNDFLLWVVQELHCLRSSAAVVLGNEGWMMDPSVPLLGEGWFT